MINLSVEVKGDNNVIWVSVEREGTVVSICVEGHESVKTLFERAKILLADAFSFVSSIHETLPQPEEPQPEEPRPSPPTTRYVPDVSEIMNETLQRYPHVPREVIDAVFGKILDNLGITHDRLLKASPEECEKLRAALFDPIGETGLQNVMVVESMVKGEVLLPDDPKERGELLKKARRFVYIHPVLSQCPERDRNIDEWSGFFYYLYEHYRLKPEEER